MSDGGGGELWYFVVITCVFPGTVGGGFKTYGARYVCKVSGCHLPSVGVAMDR